MYVLYLILVILQEYDLAAVKILLSYIIEENISCFSDITVPYKELKVFIFHTFHLYLLWLCFLHHHDTHSISMFLASTWLKNVGDAGSRSSVGFTQSTIINSLLFTWHSSPMEKSEEVGC